MHITDRNGREHTVTFLPDKILLDEALVARWSRHGNAVTVHGFTIPEHVRRSGIGGAIIFEGEMRSKASGVTDIRVVLDDKTCPVHSRFWTKHGYEFTGSTWHKTIRH